MDYTKPSRQLSRLRPLAGVLRSAMLVALCTQQASAFSLDDVSARAKELNARPWTAPTSNLPAVFSNMQFADYMQIQPRTDRFEWRNQKTPFKLGYYHQGMRFNTPIRIHEINGNSVTPVSYSSDRFQFGSLKLNPADESPLGYAGFRVLYPLNDPLKEDEIMSVLGASYFRVIGKQQAYGLSARGLAIDTAIGDGKGEEFPHFTEFWVQRPTPQDRSLTFYALLESPRSTGAYKFVLTPGADALLDVQARVYLRGKVTRVGIAPLTSMFLYGPNQLANRRNYRPAIHDSNGLAMHNGNGEWIWRPLNNPQELAVSTYRLDHPKGFGLLQRGRDFQSYQDLKDRYDLRPSAWIEPRGDWGSGSVQLAELPTPDETNDNIVAYWLPDTLPPAGQPLAFDYRIHWTMDEAGLLKNEVAMVNNTFHTDGEQLQSNLIRQSDGTTAFLVDFKGESLNAGVAPVPTPQLSIGENGEILGSDLQPNPATGGWRLSLRIKVKDPLKPVELRAALFSGKRALTETWSYQLPPRSNQHRTF